MKIEKIPMFQYKVNGLTFDKEKKAQAYIDMFDRGTIQADVKCKGRYEMHCTQMGTFDYKKDDIVTTLVNISSCIKDIVSNLRKEYKKVDLNTLRISVNIPHNEDCLIPSSLAIGLLSF